MRTDDAAEDIQAASAPVNISEIPDLPPQAVMQTNHIGRNGSIVHRINISTFSDGSTYYVLLCFVELDPRVNATGLRVFNLSINGVSLSYGLDIYQRVGLNRGYVIYANISLVTNANVMLVEARSAPTSLYPPTIAGVEILQLLDGATTNSYNATSSNDGTNSTIIVNVGRICTSCIYIYKSVCTQVSFGLSICWTPPHTQYTWCKCKCRAYLHLIYISSCSRVPSCEPFVLRISHTQYAMPITSVGHMHISYMLACTSVMWVSVLEHTPNN